MNKLGEKIREMRKKRNLTQRELADALRISHTYISKIEAGKARPSEQFVENCAYVFGVRPDVLRPIASVVAQGDGEFLVLAGSAGAIVTREGLCILRDAINAVLSDGYMCDGCKLDDADCGNRCDGYGNG